ncbi:MAG: VOC family protein [Acidimicrobiia bacterium]
MPDLEASKRWWATALGTEPYFDQPFYVGFDVGGYELGLMPVGDGGVAESVVYWGVRDVEAAVESLVGRGAVVRDPVEDVGEGIRMAVLTVPDGSVVGVIENPNFAATLPPADPAAGPGR